MLLSAMLLGSYRFDKYFTRKPAEDYPVLEKVYFDSAEKDKISLGDFVDMASLANAVRYARDGQRTGQFSDAGSLCFGRRTAAVSEIGRGNSG